LSLSPGIPACIACSIYPIPLVGMPGFLSLLLGFPDGHISSKFGTIHSPLKKIDNLMAGVKIFNFYYNVF